MEIPLLHLAPFVAAGLVPLMALVLILRLLTGGRGGQGAKRHRRVIRALRRTPVEGRAVLNKAERQVHQDLSLIVARSSSHHLLAQVSMGEFLCLGGRQKNRSRWQTVFNAFNAKRVDFLIVDAHWQPVMAVEYQGKGHHQGNAESRDAIKRAVLAKANIPLMEVASTGLSRDQKTNLYDMISKDRRSRAA